MKQIKINIKPSKLQADINTKGDVANLNLNGQVTYSPLDCSTTINQTIKDTILQNGQKTYTFDRLHYTGLDSVILDVSVQGDPYPVPVPDPSAYNEGYEQGYEDASTLKYEEGYNQGESDQKDKLISLVVTENGTYSTEDGYSDVSVNVPTSQPTPLQDASVTYTDNGEYTISPDPGYALSRVDVSVNLDTSAYYQEGYVVGVTAGYNNGYHDGEVDGYNEGYPAGEAAQKAKLDSSTFTANGHYYREDGWNDVSIAVPMPTYVSQHKDVTYTSNGEYSVSPDQGYDGLLSVDVSVNIDTSSYYDQGFDAGVADQKSKLDSSTFTQNGTYTRADGWDSITVDVSTSPGGSLQSKTVDASTSQITVMADPYFYGLSDVTVTAVDASIDSNIIPENIKDGVTILGVQGTLVPDSSGPSYDIYDSLTFNNDGFIDTGVPVSLTTIVEYQGTTLDDGAITHGVYTQNEGNSEMRFFGYGGSFYYDRREGSYRLIGGYNDGSTHIVEGGNFYLSIDGTIVDQNTTITENDFEAKYSDAYIAIFGAYTKQDMSDYQLANGSVTVNYFKIYDGSTLVREMVPAQDASGNIGMFDKVENVFYPNLESGTGTLGNYVETIGGGGSSMHPQQKVVDASTSAIIVTPDTSLGYNALSRVTVNAVDASIDPDIIPSNIRSGVEILGVTGTMTSTYNGRNQAKVADSSTTQQTIEFDSPDYTGLSEVVINPYYVEDISVDSSTGVQVITPSINYDALSSVTINPYVLDSKTVDASTSAITVTSDASALSSVTIRAVDASIDPNIIPENIKAGVNILGVTGELADDTQIDLQTKTVTPSTSQIEVTADAAYDGLGTVYVNAAPTYDVSIDASTDIQALAPNSGYVGFSQVTINPYVLQSKTVDSSTGQRVVHFDSGYNGLEQVIVNPYTVQDVSVNPSTGSFTVYPDSSHNAISSVTVRAVDASIDPNIVPANIVNGITILGVTGTYVGPNTVSDGYEEIYRRMQTI